MIVILSPGLRRDKLREGLMRWEILRCAQNDRRIL